MLSNSLHIIITLLCQIIEGGLNYGKGWLICKKISKIGGMVLKLVVGNLEGNKVKNEKKAQRLFSGALYLQNVHTMNVLKLGEGS